MTDTPRTLAELDALYADNTAGAISPQDLRDGFHSVAAPVAGGGFDTVAFGPATQFLSGRYSPEAIANAVVDQHHDMSEVSADYFYDPSGMLGVTDFHSTYIDDDFLAGEYVRLGVGAWMIQADVTWDANTTGERISEPFHIDSRFSLDNGVNPMFGMPNQWQMISNAVYQKAADLPANRQGGTTALFVITQAMLDTEAEGSPAGSGWAIVQSLWQDSGSERAIGGRALVIARIG